MAAPLAPGALLRWSVVRPLLPANGTCLEIGAGTGGFASRLEQRFDYVGLEPDAAAYSVGRQRLRSGVLLNVGYDDADAPVGPFDLVCAFEVLEHIENDKAALVDWVGRLRPGGTLLMSVPAGAHRMSAWDEAVGHFRRYDKADMFDLLASAGLVEPTVHHYGSPLGYLLEAARNAVARRADQAPVTVEERTARSGRWLQPTASWAGWLIRLTAAPFALLQKVMPGGTGLIVAARRPRDHARPPR